MKKTAVFFGSDTGNTEAAAKQIASLLDADIFDVADSPIEKIEAYENLIFGTSTMGVGDLQGDWENFLTEVEGVDLNGKTVAIFGLGDGEMFSDSFVDGIGTIYEAIKDKGCKIVGWVDNNDYNFDESTALIDGKFAGLPLDDDNQSDMTEARIQSWTEQLKKEMA